MAFIVLPILRLSGFVRNLPLKWNSAAEGIRFAKTMRRMEQICRSVTAEGISETQNIPSKL